jgi:hypothetical protein
MGFTRDPRWEEHEVTPRKLAAARRAVNQNLRDRAAGIEKLSDRVSLERLFLKRLLFQIGQKCSFASSGHGDSYLSYRIMTFDRFLGEFRGKLELQTFLDRYGRSCPFVNLLGTSEQSKRAGLYRPLRGFVPFGVDPFYPQMSSQDFE